MARWHGAAAAKISILSPMNGKSLESLLESAVPPQILTADLKNSLIKARAQIDRLGLIDPQTNEIYLNEKNIRDALRMPASENAVKRFLGRLEASLDQNRLVTAQDIARRRTNQKSTKSGY